MSDNGQSGASALSMEDDLHASLARGNVTLASATPILQHLLENHDRTMFSDEIIARIGGMVMHVARQILDLLEANSEKEFDGSQFVDLSKAFASAISGNSEFLTHLHALAIETQMTERLSERSGLDPVLSPLLQDFVASGEEEVATAAMRALAAQARFVQHQRRMELPLSELPEPLFDLLLQYLDELGGQFVDTNKIAPSLRAHYDPAKARTAQLCAVLKAMPYAPVHALEIDHAGVAFFLTALHLASGETRDVLALALCESQVARLSLSLRCGSAETSEISQLLSVLHPDVKVPEGVAGLDPTTAVAMLAQTRMDQ